MKAESFPCRLINQPNQTVNTYYPSQAQHLEHLLSGNLESLLHNVPEGILWDKYVHRKQLIIPLLATAVTYIRGNAHMV